MDILAPKLMWIGGRCYRVNKTNEQLSDIENTATVGDGITLPVLEQYIEKDSYVESEGDNEERYDIVQTNSSRFNSAFHVPKSFYGLLIGARGTTRKRIESETKTVLKVPQAGADGDVEVSGNTRGAVAAARRRIELIVIAGRAKQVPTHFLCVPITQRSIKERFRQFESAVNSGPAVFGLAESMFQNADKLHLTFGVLALMDNVDRQLAESLLQECTHSIIKPILHKYGGSIDFHIDGIECMNDDPSEVHVLYGRVVSEPLQLIADQMVHLFLQHGLMRREREHVKLHMTLINSRFQRDSGDRLDDNYGCSDVEGEKKIRRQVFDSRGIIQKFGAFDFGKQTLQEIHLSRRFTTSCTTGFYDASAVLKIF